MTLLCIGTLFQSNSEHKILKDKNLKKIYSATNSKCILKKCVLFFAQLVSAFERNVLYSASSY